MHQSVIDTFPTFTERFEGKVEHMYLDCLGLVTVGLGCLIDPFGLAACLPWVTRDTGRPATPTEVSAEWYLIKGQQNLAKLHYKFAGKQCKLKLTDEGIAKLATDRLELFEKTLRKTFPEWDNWPADAQLAVMSMSWAMGAGFTKTFKTFTKLMQERKFVQAAEQCTINPKGNPGVIPRNKANRELLLCAALAYGPTGTGYDATKVSDV